MSFSQAEKHFADAKSKTTDNGVRDIARGLEELTKAIKDELEELKQKVPDR